DEPEVAVVSATDPANPYGATLHWPAARSTPAPSGQSAGAGPSTADPAPSSGRGPTRSVGATVILVNGAPPAYLAPGHRVLATYLPEAEPDRSKTARAIAAVLIDRARWGDPPRGMLLEEIDGVPPSTHPLAPFLADAGFIAGALGMQATFRNRQMPFERAP